MSVSEFDDRSKEPTLSDLHRTLGGAEKYLQDIEEHLMDHYGELTRDWKFYGKKAGWTLALAQKKRRVFHLIPQSGWFTAVFTLGERAVLASRESDFPAEIKDAIEEACQYPEGRSIRLDVDCAEDVVVVKQLVTIKMST